MGKHTSAGSISPEQMIQQIQTKLPNCDLSDKQIKAMCWLTEACLNWSRVHNLTAFKTPSSLINGHIIDSLSLKASVDKLPHKQRWLDFGTGPGFPGLVLAIIRPDHHFVLLDSHSKKLAFVRHAKATLELDNVEVVHQRIEDYQPTQGFDIITARAVATIETVIHLTHHLLEPNGHFWLLKGPNWPDESWKHTPNQVILLSENPKRYCLIIKRSYQ